MSVPTPHISAQKGDFARTVLMPGDPLRAKFIAENFLSDPVLVNNVRGVQGYTGTYDGVRVSVMASGMGMPSIAIYSYELFNFYDVENIIRVGSAGGIHPSLQVRDIVAGIGACTNSAFQDQFGCPGHLAATANYDLLRTAVDTAEEMNIKMKVGTIFSEDGFYDQRNEKLEVFENMRKLGVLAVEMEAAALYLNAMRAGKRALAICTISDCIFTGENLPAEDRQNTFTQMMEIALKTAVKMDRF